MLKKIRLSIVVILLLSFGLSSCGGNSQLSVLKKCKTLGDESIAYARANYVKLFYHFNPEKFNKTYQKIKTFDYVTHRNIINTYDLAVRKLKTKDTTTEAFLSSCKKLSQFSKNLVDQAYPRAIAHKSNFDSLSDDFFLEINKIVRFDHNIGQYGKKMYSFKHQVEAYQLALNNYVEKFKIELSKQKY